MVSLLTTSDSCVNIAGVSNGGGKFRAGWGLPTTWVVSGESELYTGTLETDGY